MRATEKMNSMSQLMSLRPADSEYQHLDQCPSWSDDEGCCENASVLLASLQQSSTNPIIRVSATVWRAIDHLQARCSQEQEGRREKMKPSWMSQKKVGERLTEKEEEALPGVSYPPLILQA